MSTTDRLHALDAVRGFALLLGVVFHAGFSFLPGMIPGIWAIVDTSPSTAISVLIFSSHIFRMSLFFFIAGFFARMMLQRKGLRGFWSDRAKRILAPMLIGWAVLFPAIAVVWVWGLSKTFGEGPPPAPLAGLPAPPPLAFPLTHLWFLYYLLWLYAIVLLIRGAIVALDRRGVIRRAAHAIVAGAVRSGAAVLLGVPLAISLYFRSDWIMWFGIPTPDRSLIPEVASLVGFGTAMAFGWLVARQIDLLQVWRRQWPFHLAGALTLTIACLWIAGLTPALTVAGPGLQRLAFAIAYSLAIWCWVFAITGLAVRFLSNESPARRYLPDSSYWIYLAHLPVVAAFQVLVGHLPWHWSVKFPLILVASFVVLFASYHVFVRFSFIGAILNGRKHPPFDSLPPPRSALRRTSRSLRAGAATPETTDEGPARPTRSERAEPAEGAHPERSSASRRERATENRQERVEWAELRGVHKRYGKTVALAGIDLEVRRGELLAVLGPNGAGKSTAVSLWLGLLEPDEGTATLMGRSPLDVESRRRVGVMMQEVALPLTLTVREHVHLAASYYPNPLAADEALALTRTTALAHRKYGALSAGQRRQAQFAIAICGRPRLLFLDEPTVGLDVQARELMWQTMRELVKQGCSIVLTTHYLEEAEALADRVVVLAKGRVIASGSVDQIRSVVSRKRISCSSAVGLDEVRAWPDVVEARHESARLHITAIDAEAVVRRLLDADQGLRDLEVRQAGLSEAFTELTKEAA